MKKLIAFAVLAFGLVSCGETVQGNGQVKKETREAAPFESIDVSGEYEVHIKPANYSSLTIEADENLLQHIESYVKDGTLYVESKENFSRYRELNLYISVETFKGLETSGASTVMGKGLLTGENMDFDFSGAAEVDLELQADKIDAEFSGACEVKFAGNAETLNLETSGAVEFDGENLKTQNCRLEMSGAGEAVVFVTEKLDISVSGAAQIRYKGSPSDIKQDISGAADISQLQ